MAHIKKLVMKGFKSFVKQTELPFTKGINVILGPNGSGKSNVSDALCFVLGRLSIKSMRAAKASNLIFLGSKAAPPAKEASVEIVFDNSEEIFAIDSREISIKRIVRKNGQSIYKINGDTKTRQDILSLLAQAGIDPNGFNIILQGEIQNFVRMHNDERRKVIEEVSGISVYEMRKEKSLKELSKTEEKLKEVTAVLRERTSYLNNLEKERQEALRFKKLEEDVKKFRKSILSHDLGRKRKESEDVQKQVDIKNKEIQKIKSEMSKLEGEIKNLEAKIEEINSTIKKSTGLEQEKLNQEIANIRAEIAGLTVKKENHETKISDIQRKKTELRESIRNLELEIRELQKESPTIAKKEKELSQKKNELERLEEQRKKFYMAKTELKSLRERIQEKKAALSSLESESNYILKQIEASTLELFDKKADASKLEELKSKLIEKKEILRTLDRREIELEKISHTNEYEIDKQKKIIENIAKMDKCPLCKSEITEEHIDNIENEVKPEINSLQRQIEKADHELNQIYERRDLLKRDIEEMKSEIVKRESDRIKLSDIKTRQEQIKSLREKTEAAKQEIQELEKKRSSIEKTFDENSNIEHKYEIAKIEVQEISLKSQENVDSEIAYKQRELERSNASLKQIMREEEDLAEDLELSKKTLDTKQKTLQRFVKQEEQLSQKFETMISRRDDLQRTIRERETDSINKRNSLHSVEQEINTFRIEKARFDAEIENLEIEILEFPDAEIIRGKKENLLEKLEKTKNTLARIGSVNLRSLEVYDSVKEEYDRIKDKVDIINNEKESIMKVIHEIDVKKKKTFLKTLDALNEMFSRNFSQLSTKGEVSLDLENRKDPFSAGVGITVKTGHGKYFDVTSLSGGEQTLVALSLIFAIQELKPYYFYILDEIDAALDKRNSERLAGLLKKYMKKGQYLVITHNDEIITNATALYGVSMHDGVSKVTSLEL